MKNDASGFSTSLRHWNLPKRNSVEIWFANDSDIFLFSYTTSSIKSGCTIFMRLDDAVLSSIKEVEDRWKFLGVEHVKPTRHSQNPRDFYYMKFEVSFAFLDLIKILEEIYADDEEG